MLGSEADIDKGYPVQEAKGEGPAELQRVEQFPPLALGGDRHAGPLHLDLYTSLLLL